MKISNFGKVQFTSQRISDLRFYRFVYDFLQRLQTNNASGSYTAMFNETKAEFENFYGKLTEEDLSHAQKEGSTVQVTSVQNEILSRLAKSEAVIFTLWDRSSSQYEEFFPNGLTEFRAATRSALLEKFDRFIAVAENYAEELPAGFISTLQSLRSDYDNALQAQRSRFGKVDRNRELTNTLRSSLETKMTRNVLVLALEFAGQPDKLDTFFDESLLYSSHRRPDAVVQYQGNPAAGARTIVTTGTFTGDTNWLFVNTGNTLLKFYTTQSAGDEVPTVTLSVEPESEEEVNTRSLGAENNKVLMCYNPSDRNEGNFIAEVMEKVK